MFNQAVDILIDDGICQDDNVTFEPTTTIFNKKPGFFSSRIENDHLNILGDYHKFSESVKVGENLATLLEVSN